MTDPKPSNHELPLSAMVYTILLCVLFGSNAVAVKVAFSGIGVFTSAAIRFGIAAMAIYLWSRITGEPLAAAPNRPDFSGPYGRIIDDRCMLDGSWLNGFRGRKARDQDL